MIGNCEELAGNCCVKKGLTESEYGIVARFKRKE